jgi:hypothetical protein
LYRHIIPIALAIIGFIVNESMVATAQDNNPTNSTKSDKPKIIVTWVEANNTYTDTVPVISISGEDFWKIFGPLLEQSTR